MTPPDAGQEQASAGTLLYCRPGFEGECAQEISALAAALDIGGYVKARADSGYALFVPYDNGAGRLRRGLRFADFVFARQVVHEAVLCAGLPTGDRITPLLEAVRRHFGGGFGTLWMETADTNEAKELSGFLKRFTPAFTSALRKAGLLQNDAAAARLHVFFLGSGAAYIGASDVANSSPWPLGIPRLKMPRGAPSRSTLKLVEAMQVFLSAAERDEWLREGRTGADLGAAPGGWTWQLVQRGLHVTAIDNGALDPALLANDQVEHLRADAFHWRPKRPVDWLVCDMVEKPARVAALIADWIADGHAKRAVFNLKLPMKKRREELETCILILRRRLASAEFSLNFRQLYHDREEVTGYLRPTRTGTR